MTAKRMAALLSGAALTFSVLWIAQPGHSATGSGPALLPQGTQTDAQFAASYAAHHVRSTEATTAKTSCYRPEVPYFTDDGPADGYSGMSACPGATTG